VISLTIHRAVAGVTPAADGLFTDQESVPILKMNTAEGPAVKRGHRQRSLPYAGGGRISMQDRHTPTSGVRGDILTRPCAYCVAGTEGATAANGWTPERLVHLYLCRGLSTYRIAELTGLDRQRVTRALHRAGVPLRPRGAGRLRPVRRLADRPGLPQLITDLYEVGRLSSRQIAAITGLPERTVRDRLRRYGIQARTRGGWNREDRRTVPAGILRDL
jgi:hypothetical protein